MSGSGIGPYRKPVQFTDAWVIPNPDGGETGVLLRLGKPESPFFYVICPAASTLFPDAPSGDDWIDCYIGNECDFLDTVHTEAARMVKSLPAANAGGERG